MPLQVGFRLGIACDVSQASRAMLLLRIERYLRLTGTPPTRFGRESLGDPCFVFDLRAGREPRPDTAGRVLTFIESHGVSKDDK